MRPPLGLGVTGKPLVYPFLASTIHGIKSSNQVVIEVCEVLSTSDWQGIPV